MDASTSLTGGNTTADEITSKEFRQSTRALKCCGKGTGEVAVTAAPRATPNMQAWPGESWKQANQRTCSNACPSMDSNSGSKHCRTAAPTRNNTLSHPPNIMLMVHFTANSCVHHQRHTQATTCTQAQAATCMQARATTHGEIACEQRREPLHRIQLGRKVHSPQVSCDIRHVFLHILPKRYHHMCQVGCVSDIQHPNVVLPQQSQHEPKRPLFARLCATIGDAQSSPFGMPRWQRIGVWH